MTSGLQGLDKPLTRMNSWVNELKKTAVLAVPMVLNQVSQHMIQVIDSAMIGRVGVVQLAASAFAASVFTIPIVFCFGLAITVSVLVSSAYGEDNLKKANHALRLGLVISSAVAAVLVVLFMAGAPLLKYLGQTDEVYREAVPYYFMLLVSMVPAIVFACSKNYMEAMSRPWIPLWVTVGMLLSNVFFNWVFIFGKLGAPELGLVGAGIGTLLARLLSAAALLIFIGVDPSWNFKFFTLDWVRIKWFEAREFLALGIPSGFQIIFEVSAFVMAAIMMGWIGEATLAAHQISINVAALTFMVVLGISFATTIRVGQFLGRKDYQGLRRAGVVGWVTNATFMFTCMVMLIAFRSVIPTWFVENSQVVEIASGLLIIAAMFQVFDGIQISMMSSLRGMRDVKVPTYIVMFVYYGVCLPLAYLLAFRAGLQGVGIWIGLASGLALSALLLSVRFYIKSRKLILESEELRA